LPGASGVPASTNATSICSLPAANIALSASLEGSLIRLYLSSFRLGNRPDALLDLLAGRTRAAVIANADDGKPAADRIASYEREDADLRGLGLAPAELDLRAYFGRPEALAERLAGIDLIWARGGNPFILRRSLRQSGADDLIVRLLADDSLVYAGYSAGAAMMTPTLRGIDLVDDPASVPDGYDAAPIWECLAALPYCLLPHYKSDHPESAAIDKSLAYMVDNHMLFIALRDGEAFIRNGDLEFIAA
jgi:dipeptidase E